MLGLACFVIVLRIANCAASSPNIVLIVIDDLGWDDISLHGSDQIPTPNIDKLAAEGVLLENYYTQAICTPSRGALMTGKYPIHLGLQYDVIQGAQPYGLPTDFKIMPQYLSGTCYKSHIIGKWHLGHSRSELLPTRRGFHSHFGFRLGHSDYFNHWGEESSPVKNEMYAGLDLWSNEVPIKKYHGTYANDLFTKRAISILETHNKTTPLFLYLAHQAVHVGDGENPLQAPLSFVKKFEGKIYDEKRKHYAAMVSAMDASIGELMHGISTNGFAENTIIFLTNDNGGPTNGMASSGSSNHPLRGCKYTLWEGGTRGSALFWYPKKLGAGTYKGMAHITDVLPTLLTASGNAVAGNFDGYDLWDALSTNAQPRKDLLYNIDPVTHSWAVRSGDFKLITDNALNGEYSGWYPTVESVNLTRTVKCGSASKACDGSKRPCLFNLAADPCEENDIFDERPDMVRKLMVKLNEYQTSMRPMENRPNSAAADPARFDFVWMPWEDYELGGLQNPQRRSQ
ncbi:arylsulfatase B [Galendromus occidentalis]|uniref:Arylsulfatase B n=1 Tax=Galendromus occidentalis TaxID=34638 RepID=A0AAJ7PAW4_9ACAR|nr:arylsulfatase B [Galendromus occidentalis]